MENRQETRPRMVRTPLLKIPIGEPIRNAEGRLGLRMKKQGEQEYEDVWLDQMLSMIAREANR